MEPPEVPADAEMSQSAGQTLSNPLGSPSLTSLVPDEYKMNQPWEHSLQQDFQDSNMSPALPLLPENSGVGNIFSEYSLFQHSENEFAPLRGYPDMSMASERFHFPPQETTEASELGSLSQHPLVQATIQSEEGVSSCCSLSQHSLSPGDEPRPKEADHSPMTAATDIQELPSEDDAGSRQKDSGTNTELPVNTGGEAADYETFFLSKDVPAQHLLKLLEKDVGILSSSSSAVSSASETSVKSTLSFSEDSKSTKVCSGTAIDQSTVRREGPSGEASISQLQTKQPERDLDIDQSSKVSNISMGNRSTRPDDSSEVLHRELLFEVERCRSLPTEAESKNKPQRSSTAPSPSFTPYPTGAPEGKPSVTTNLGGVPWTGPFSVGIERGHRVQDLWSSGNQTGIDGSYLGFLPQSQSTPGVFKAPSKSSAKSKLGQLSAIESNKENSHQSNTRISPQPAFPSDDVQHLATVSQCREEATAAKVQSLPSLNYMQKVDAWRENQSSGKTSLFDSLALQGFSGVSPKKKAYEAVSDTLNRLLSQQAKTLQQTPVSNIANPDVTQTSSAAPSGSSLKRGEAVGGAPTDKDTTRLRPSASSFDRSQSHSSVTTVVMSTQKDNPKRRPRENEKSQIQEDFHHQPSTTVEPSPLKSLGQFSDVSLDRDFTLSSSQDSNNSGVKVAASIGTSSVVSLEVDNYAPYWTSKVSTPPPHPTTRELNIEERIPLYLHNLGIDQSPSTILTPFVPRGPIREPEFSPTDLCTIKGSIGTPTKSIQASEGGSHHKGEFSRSSILSVDSSMSLPFSVDSLGPVASIFERPRRASPLSEPEDNHSDHRLGPSSLPDEDSYPSTQQSTLQRQRDSSLTSSQNTIQHGDRFDSNLSLATDAKCEGRDSEPHSTTSRSIDKSQEISFVSSQALLEIRNLLSQKDNVLSPRSSAASPPSPAVPRLLSDDDIFLSLRKKTSGIQDSPTSHSAREPKTHSSLLWARSSSDSMLTSEKPRENSIGRESIASSGQLNYKSTQALVTAPATAAHRRPKDTIVSGVAGSFVLSQSGRRAEPEGCSAAPPDNTALPQPPPVTKPQPASPTQPLSSSPQDTSGDTEEVIQDSPAQSGSSSPAVEDTDQGVMSDSSSQSSLAVRVAKLLQSESPATMVSSTASVTDHEESKAREWIKLKISGQHCEPLELDKEDRKRIEEIKRELLLKYPIKSQVSTDTESSAASSVRIPRGQDLLHRAEPSTSNQASQTQGLDKELSNSSLQLQNPPLPHLEAQIREIAAREGVTFRRTNPLALKSITIATRKRSNSSSPSASPVPPLSPALETLHLNELSTGPAKLNEAEDDEDRKTRETTSNLLAPGNRKRQDAVGSHLAEPPPLTQGHKGTSQLPLRGSENLSVQDSSVSGAGLEDEQATGSSTSSSPARTGHVSHVHLTLSPKATDLLSPSAVPSSLTGGGMTLPRKEFVPLRYSSSAAISPDEGVGLSSPPEWNDARERVRLQGTERADTSTLFKTKVPEGRTTITKLLTTDAPAVPLLLPYKPRGSEELFYVPQTEADISSTDRSDTTMESSHTGSDDAVPPRFSSDVLGTKDPGLDRGVTIRHTEGIYSKRLKTTTFRMNEPGPRVSTDRTSQTNISTPAPAPSSHVPAAFTSVPLATEQKASKRDQWTSPVPSLSSYHPEPVHVDMGYNRRHYPDQGVISRGARRVEHDQEHHDLPPPTEAELSSSNLDQLWQRFCAQWSQEEFRRRSEREASLLERLERLSRLIHSKRGSYFSEGGERVGRRSEDATGRERWKEVKRSKGGKKTEGEASSRHVRLQETSLPVDEERRDSSTSTFSHDDYASSTSSPHLYPADGDHSDTISTASGSMSTVDTARLIRVYGAHRVQNLKTGSSLGKLYSAINRQKEGRGRNKDPSHIIPSITTDESTVSTNSASSISTYMVSSHHGPSRTLAAKRKVKLVNKGIQAGDLELVCNGTRHHTRDVGTTFPSPGDARTSRLVSSSSPHSERGRGGMKSPSKPEGPQKHRKSKKSPAKTYPEGVSWFIPADDLRSEARKENWPEEQELISRPSTAWFEPYSRVQPWRQPLRQRQVHEDRNVQTGFILQEEPDPESRTKTISAALAQISLQEALLMRRPEFISQSRQRVRRLAVRAEERKLQENFSQERDGGFIQTGGERRLPRPAGIALMKRAVPRKEMIQRTKQMSERLPEVRRRKEEERRKAEYRSYILNAQLYSKRITSRVLGRRTAWQ